jgi:GxxExxY protein
MTKKTVNDLAYRVIGCAIEVHKQLGPGLLESVYERCLAEEFLFRNISFERQAHVPIYYRGRKLAKPLRVDFLVSDSIIVELKAVENLLPVHQAQLLSYMRLGAKPKGLLINFHSENLVKASVHLVNEYFRNLPDE